MKKSLRQDAEHKNPIVDLDWSLFSSGVCWHLPVPSVIIKKTSVFSPPIVGSLSQASFTTGHENPWLPLHTSWVCSESPSPSMLFYAGRLSFLPFNTEGYKVRQSSGESHLYSCSHTLFIPLCTDTTHVRSLKSGPFLSLCSLFVAQRLWESCLLKMNRSLMLQIKH